MIWSAYIFGLSKSRQTHTWFTTADRNNEKLSVKAMKQRLSTMKLK